MAEQDILQSVYPYIGGQENVSRTIPRKGTLYLMLKDAGVVNLAAVNQVQGVISAELGTRSADPAAGRKGTGGSRNGRKKKWC